MPSRDGVPRRTQPPPRGERTAENVPCLQRNRAGTATSRAGRSGHASAARGRMSPCAASRSSRPTATPTSTRSRPPSPLEALPGRRRLPDRLAQPQRPRVPPAARRRAADASRRRGSSSTRSGGSSSSRRSHASRLGELERVALDPGSRRSSSTTTRASRPSWVAPESAILSEDGALTTTLVGILAERELARDPGRGDALRARDPRGHGLAHLPDRDAARRGRARLVPAPRRRPAPGGRRSCTRRSAPTSASCSRPCSRELETREVGGVEVLSARSSGRATSTGSRTWRTRSST